MTEPKIGYIYSFDIFDGLYKLYKIENNDMFFRPLKPWHNKSKYNGKLQNYIIPIGSIAHEKSRLEGKLTPRYKRLFGSYISSLDTK